MKFLSSAYGPPWTDINGTGVTATGVDLTDSPKVYLVAVDPKIIPLHTKMNIWPNPFGAPAIFVAEDTGSAIIGRRVDFYDWRGRKSQLGWGMRTVEVTILGTASQPVRPPNVARGTVALPSRPALMLDPQNAGGTVTDYSYVIRATRININRLGAYLRLAGLAIRGLHR